MGSDSLTEELKARVPESLKVAVEELAKKRHLKPADIVREALREFIADGDQPATGEGK